MWLEGVVKIGKGITGKREGHARYQNIGPTKTQKGTWKRQKECNLDSFNAESKISRKTIENNKINKIYLRWNQFNLFELLNKKWSHNSPRSGWNYKLEISL